MDLVITILILVAVQLVLYFVLKGRIDQELNASRLLKEVQDEVDGMVRELNLTAERNIGLLEARIGEMEELLDKADQRLLLLTKESERRDRVAEVYTHLKRPAPREVVQPELEIESTEAVVPEPLREPEPETPSEAPLTVKDRVLAGYRQGWDAAEIARQTGVARAEVELILSLNAPF